MHPKDAHYLELCIHSKFNEFWTQDAEVKKITGAWIALTLLLRG
jgi:hypothetical protein